MHVSLRAAGAISILFVVTAAAAAGNDPLDEIVVTAELREKSLQQLPASATVLDDSAWHGTGACAARARETTATVLRWELVRPAAGRDGEPLLEQTLELAPGDDPCGPGRRPSKELPSCGNPPA